MLKEDFKIFLLFFAYFMSAFFFTFYILYPRASEYTIPIIPAANSIPSSLVGLLELAFTGSALNINLLDDTFDQLNGYQQVDVILWLALYVFYVLISLILLLNLLIASAPSLLKARVPRRSAFPRDLVSPRTP